MQLSGRKIPITGATGFIGSHLADRPAVDNELVLIDDFSIGRRENLRRPGDVTRHLVDVRKAERLVGFRAQTALERGLMHTIEWFRPADIPRNVDTRGASTPNQ